MIWTVRIGNDDAAVVKVSDVLLNELIARLRDAEIKQIDPYRNVTLDRHALTHWQAELTRIMHDLHVEAGARLKQARHLPRAAPARELILNDWVERERADSRDFQDLQELVAAVEMALEGGGVIVAIGD
jgi:hypothetical protein